MNVKIIKMNTTESPRIFFEDLPTKLKTKHTTKIYATTANSIVKHHNDNTTTMSSTNISTEAPNTIQEQRNFEMQTLTNRSVNEINNKLSHIEYGILIITVILTLILIYKVTKKCIRWYQMHNERVIQRHSRTTIHLN